MAGRVCVAGCGLWIIAGLFGCGTAPRPGDVLRRQGDEISIAGQLVHTGTRVVLWNDPGGYDAYRAHRHFEPEERGPSGQPERVQRYGSFRRGLPEGLETRVREEGWTLDAARSAIRQVVIHFDACGTSRQCFRVLHDIRGLSSHFLLDLDGTVYQTLDLKERAWHAAQANDRSVGIEIAHIGAYADRQRLDAWYAEDGEGLRVTLPEEFGDGGLPENFVARPARSELQRGVIQGRELAQYDFTEEQYIALEKLLVALCRALPGILPRFPRDADGQVVREVLGTGGEAAVGFDGIIGHYHVSSAKVDPGPAFDWERIQRALDDGV